MLLSDLPEDIIFYCYTFVPDIKDIGRHLCVSKNFYKELRSNYIWRNHYFKLVKSPTLSLSTTSSQLKFDFYFNSYKDQWKKTEYFLDENRQKRVQDFLQYLATHGKMQVIGYNFNRLYAIPISDVYSGSVVDVYYVSKKHYLGWFTLAIPFVLRFFSKKYSIISNLIVFLSRYYTYEIYYDPDRRWKRNRPLHYLKSMLVLAGIGFFISLYPFGAWNAADDFMASLGKFILQPMTYI